jgi:putative cell wall-binding protein
MNARPIRLRTLSLAAAVALLSGVGAALGGAVLDHPARAAAGFTLSRLQGADRYQTADVIDQAAFPPGEATVLLADGIPGHQTDALAASGLEGVSGFGVLITDNGTSVPANTLAALQDNKVKTIDVLGGTAAVSQAEINQLKGAGYTVATPYAGATRYQTMQMIDDSINPSTVGKDAAGNPTAILASGDNSHFVDALSAGGLAYALKFPIILTNSQGPGLQPEAQEVITKLGIKHLIVAGGTASIPASEYSPAPTGVTDVSVEAGADRSATSQVLADYAIQSGWLGDTALTVARGDDGSDALAGAAFAGIKKDPTVVTDSPTAVGSAASFAQEHAGTLTGTSWIFGGPAAVPDAEMSAIETAAGAGGTCPVGTITSNPVTAASPTSFTEGGCSRNYASTDTYQLATSSSTPGASPTCTADSYSDFQNRLGAGDQVTGTYASSGASTFCLDDVAPAPPSSVSAAPNTQGGGVTVTWSAPSTAPAQNVTGYQVWRAPATSPGSGAPSQLDTCPAAYSTAPGSSPQAAPATPYVALGTVTTPTSGTNYTYNDLSATASSSYCYAVSAVAANVSGTNQPATAQPASPSNPLSPSTPGPVTASTATTGAAPVLNSIAVQGQTISLTYNQAVNPASVDPDGSQFAITANAQPVTANAWASGSIVYLDLNLATAPTPPVIVTSRDGGNGTTVCAQNASSGACEAIGESKTASTVTPATVFPTIVGLSASASTQTVTVSYSEPIDCVTVDSGGGQYPESESSGGSPPLTSPPHMAACSGSSPTSTQVLLTQGIPLVPGATISVTYNADSHGYIVAGANGGGGEPANDTKSATVGQ